MKTIGQIRRERLQQLISAGVSFAELNSMLGRNRRDATLNQIAKAAPNSTTGKPREMGSTQARQIEAALKLPDGWFDTEPGRNDGIVELKLEGGKFIIFEASPEVWSTAREPDAKYNVQPRWPFKAVRPADIEALPAHHLATLERLMLAYLGKSAPVADWRPTAFRIAAELDRANHSDRFTTFVRALEVELGDGMSLAKAVAP